MKCKHCGNEIPEGSKFCNTCGAKMEIETPKDNQTRQLSTNVKKFLIEKKDWVIGYAAWFVVNFTLLLFGGDIYIDKFRFSYSAKHAFFPFKGELGNYDITEFFVYVIALPIVAYAIYHFVAQKKCFNVPKE